MKTPLLHAAVLVLCLTASRAAITVPGSMVYTQDFNVLDTVTNTSTSTKTWTDDSTIPGWLLYKAGPTNAGAVGTGYRYRVSNGEPGLGNASSLADTGHFYSIGALNDPDRALGTVAITGQGEHSMIAVFENTSGLRVRLTNIAYQAEVWRTNQNANVVETIAVSWRKGATQAGFLTNTTATANTTDWPAALSTGPSGLYVTGWNQVPAAYYTYSNSAANTRIDPAVTSIISAAPASEILLEPGELLAVRWGNINDSGADAVMGIDDVALTFVAEDTGVTAQITGVTRNDGGTPRNPADDTVSFSITVNGTGPGWQVTAPAEIAGQTGTYGQATPLTLPVAAFTSAAHSLSVGVVDQANPGGTASASVTAPWCSLSIQPAENFAYDAKGTQDLTDDEAVYTIRVDGTFTGDGYKVGFGGIIDETQTFPYGDGLVITGPPPGTYDAITVVDAADATCRATMDVFPSGIIATNSLSGTTFALLSEPIASNGAVRWNIDPSLPGLVQTGNPANADHVLLSRSVDLSGTGAVKFTGRLSAVSTTTGFEAADSFALDLIIDGTPVSVLGAYDTLPAGAPDGRLRGAAELSTVAGTANFLFSYLIPASANSVQIRVTGNCESTLESFTVSRMDLSPGGPYVLGTYDQGGGSTTPINTTEAAPPDMAWSLTGTPATVSMNGFALTAPLKTVTSEEITLAPGTWQASANLHILDLTSGFEASDEFDAYLVLNGNDATRVSLLNGHDLNSDQKLSGAELCPTPTPNPSIQNLDYPLAAQIPAGTTSVKLVFTGLCNSNNENMILSDIRIAPSTIVAGDTDGDGVSDADEAIMGTLPNDAASVLRLSTAPGGFSFPTVAGRFYRIYASSTAAGADSSHLLSWIDTGTTITGDGNTATVPVTPEAGVSRRFYRLHVKQNDTGWPAQVP